MSQEAPSVPVVAAPVSATNEAVIEQADEEPPRKRQRLEEDAESALLSALGEEDVQPVAVAEVDPLADATWEDLFGTIPRHEVFPPGQDDGAPVEEPETHDVRQALLDCFGTNFAENSVSLYQATDMLREAVQFARIEQSNDDVDACFGISCRMNLLSKPGVKLAPIAIRTAKRPKNPLRGSTTSSNSVGAPQARLLMEMPSIMPNRQILHADPEKYTPALAHLQESTPRAVHTPQNSMRWNYLPTTKTYVSNARYVKWSDNSTTLHVGGDVYETFDNVDAAMHMVAQSSSDATAEGGMDVESIPIDRHMMVRAAAGVPNSIETYIQHVSNVERSIELQSRVDAPIDALPDFDVDKDKRRPKDVTMSLEESFVKNRRAINAKELAKAHGGKPTLTDYFRAEIETLKELEEARRENKLQQQVTLTSQKIAASKVRFGKPAVATGTSRFDRDDLVEEDDGEYTRFAQEDYAEKIDASAAADALEGDDFNAAVARQE